MNKIKSKLRMLRMSNKKIKPRKIRKHRKLRANTDDEFDWSSVDWDALDEEKAKFIFEDARAEISYRHYAIEQINNKCLNLLMINIPILSALIAFVLIHRDSMSNILSTVSLFVGLSLFSSCLTWIEIIIPRDSGRATRTPAEHLANKEYYGQSLNLMRKGYLRELNEEIKICYEVHKNRSRQFILGIVFFILGPIIAALIYIFN